jgi:hypothetical protein
MRQTPKAEVLACVTLLCMLTTSLTPAQNKPERSVRSKRREESTWKDSQGRTRTRRELDQILELHALYVKSKGKSGEAAEEWELVDPILIRDRKDLKSEHKVRLLATGDQLLTTTAALHGCLLGDARQYAADAMMLSSLNALEISNIQKQETELWCAKSPSESFSSM